MRSRDPAEAQGGVPPARDAVRVERRAAPRSDVQALGVPLLGCRVNPGHDVQLANVSSVGARVESTFALLPGRVLQLHLHGRGRRVVIETRVAWCAVRAVTPHRGLRFEAGLAFSRWVDVVAELRPVRP